MARRQFSNDELLGFWDSTSQKLSEKNWERSKFARQLMREIEDGFTTPPKKLKYETLFNYLRGRTQALNYLGETMIIWIYNYVNNELLTYWT